MNDLNFGVNIDPMAIIGQHEKQTETNNFRKNVFDAKNYLNARLAQNETSKTLTIRLLPFSSENRSPFKKVITHTVKVNKEVSPSGWKTFICPEKNVFEDAKNSGSGLFFSRLVPDDGEDHLWGEIVTDYATADYEWVASTADADGSLLVVSSSMSYEDYNPYTMIKLDELLAYSASLPFTEGDYVIKAPRV